MHLRQHLDFHDMIVNIWKLKNLSDERNGVDERFFLTYSAAEVHNNRCWTVIGANCGGALGGSVRHA